MHSARPISNYVGYLRMRWNVFSYNYGWDDYVFLFEGWLAKSAMAVPLLGYLILFNDSVANHLSFQDLAQEDSTNWGLRSSARLKFIYLGLVCLGIASGLYYLCRPYVMKIGRDEFEYVERALRHFSISDYIRMNGEIRHSKFDPLTQHGKYYDSDFQGFLTSASGTATWTGDRVSQDFHGTEAKAKYESLLRSILIETYFKEKIQRRPALTLCSGLALIGYGLLSIPSADLFAKVMIVIWKAL